jgi:hypothetical protein
LDTTITQLREQICALVVARQEMRAHRATPEALEANRLELGSRQRQLSCALVERSLPGSNACAAQHEPEQSLAAGQVVADERLAA